MTNKLRHLNSDKVTRDGLLKVQQYPAHTGRETGMKCHHLRRFKIQTYANNDVMAGNTFTMSLYQILQKMEVRPTKKIIQMKRHEKRRKHDRTSHEGH